jgi:RNA polymerase sigma-70 factor (ECF subfamily)
LKAGQAKATVAGLHGESDADLLAASARQDASAFRRLVDRHYAPVYRVVWRLTRGHADSEDIAQEAFLRLWNNPGQLREASALRSWLMRVASNLAIDRLRIQPLQAIDGAEETADSRVGAEERQLQNWARRRIDAAISKLPERQRLALAMVHFEQMSNGAAAEAMELSVDALESLLARARRALKTELAEDRRDLLSAVTMEGNMS